MGTKTLVTAVDPENKEAYQVGILALTGSNVKAETIRPWETGPFPQTSFRTSPHKAACLLELLGPALIRSFWNCISTLAEDALTNWNCGTISTLASSLTNQIRMVPFGPIKLQGFKVLYLHVDQTNLGPWGKESDQDTLLSL